jgi:glycosyltransferase involved in cell wall biosynthesis
MSSGVIVLAPPWPRSGSGNIFAAQVAAYAHRGGRVFLLLTPTGRGFAHHKTDMWHDAVSSMRSPGVETVAYPRVGRGSVRAYLQWLCAGCDDSLAIMARYGASGRLPPELAVFVASARVDLIHANHVFSIPLALRVARFVHRRQGRRPRILLDTHDIQSDAFAARRKKNPLSRRLDSHDDLLRTELALCAKADALVHVTMTDCAFFASRLHMKHHAVVLPTLDPASEEELVLRRGVGGPNGAGFVYIGNQHEANLVTVRWLLNEVLPLAGPGVAERVRIVGSIGALLRRRDSELSRRHAALLAGEVPSILGYYAGAQVVLAPALAGTGTSIKLIEALCAGKPVLTTSLGLRGLPASELAGADIEVHDTAAGFAQAMTKLSAASTPAMSQANAALYDRVFSNSRYFADLEDLVDGGHRTSVGAQAGGDGHPAVAVDRSTS